MANDPAEDSYSTVLAGQPGYLTLDQEQALQTFKDRLSAAGLYSENLNDTGEPSHGVTVLLQFLRARKFDIEKAYKQFEDTQRWRAENDVDKLFANFTAEEFDVARKFYPRWTGRRDKLGIPVVVYRLASLQGEASKELFQVKQERRYARIVALWEMTQRFLHPLCTALPHPTKATIGAVTTIVDLENVSLTAIWSLRHHLQEASTIGTAYYPETIHTIAIVNSPGFFPTIWGWIKSWFDEGTRSKIHVLGKDPGPTLLELIDLENLPKTYGGNMEWKFEDEPDLDQAAKDAIGEWPSGPSIFKHGEVRRPDGTCNN